jgi:hypothetical protein
MVGGVQGDDLLEEAERFDSLSRPRQLFGEALIRRRRLVDHGQDERRGEGYEHANRFVAGDPATHLTGYKKPASADTGTAPPANCGGAVPSSSATGAGGQ